MLHNAAFCYDFITAYSFTMKRDGIIRKMALETTMGHLYCPKIS